MPPKGKGSAKKKGKGNSKKTKNTPPDPTPHFYFPREIICNILSRLPVKTLLRLKCVCKQWRNLISKPNFIADHFRHSSSLRRAGSSILVTTEHHESSDYVISLYNPPESVVELDNPFPCFFPHMYIAPPCNGIVCLFQAPWGDVITLWNPALGQSRMVQLSETKPLKGVHCWASIGLAFDFQENDLLILRIFCVGPISTVPNHVEMCSTKDFRWKKLKNEMVFHITQYVSHDIIKGVPYWLVLITDEFGMRPVFVYFDVGKKVFEKVPTLRTGERRKHHQHLVALEDSLGMLTWDEYENVDCHIDVFVMDGEDGWIKKCNVGPLFGFDHMVGCLRNGDIVAMDENGVLILFDLVTSSVKAKLSITNAEKESYVIFDYSESLVLIEGMLPVKKQDSQDKLARKNLTRACKKFMM